MSEAAMKDLIRQYLDGDMAVLACAAAEALPAEFFEVAASSSGNFHPGWALGRGGLVRHTQAVVWWTYNLLELFELSREESQAAIFAAVFHDGWKGWWDGKWQSYTVGDHGRVGARAVRAAVSHLPTNRSGTMEKVYDGIEHHMARWALEPVHFADLSPVARIVATADYVASRRVPPWEAASQGGVVGV